MVIFLHHCKIKSYPHDQVNIHYYLLSVSLTKKCKTMRLQKRILIELYQLNLIILFILFTKRKSSLAICIVGTDYIL